MGSLISKAAVKGAATTSETGGKTAAKGGGSLGKSGPAPVVVVEPTFQKIPAGHYDDSPRITLYLGHNTGPYHRNGTETVPPPVPVEWIISPRTVEPGQCPTGRATLTAFGLANLLYAFLAIFLCCRPLVYKLTFGLFAQRGSKSVYWSWFISTATSLSGNLVGSIIVVRTPGYESLALRNVFALFCARPRVGIWWLAILRTCVSKKAKQFPGPPIDYPDEHIYVDSYIPRAIAEVIIRIVAAAFIGITWARFPNEPSRHYMQSAIVYMEVAPGLAFLGAFLAVPVYRRYCESWPPWSKDPNNGAKDDLLETALRNSRNVNRTGGMRKYDDYDMSTTMGGMPKKGHDYNKYNLGYSYKPLPNEEGLPTEMILLKANKKSRVGVVIGSSLLVFIPLYVAPWVYWSHFLKLPGSLWCPPKLPLQTAIWIAFTALGDFLSAGSIRR